VDLTHIVPDRQKTSATGKRGNRRTEDCQNTKLAEDEKNLMQKAKRKSRVSLTLLSFEPRGVVFFPCGSLFIGMNPGRKDARTSEHSLKLSYTYSKIDAK
jgi:hypothetical protein